MVAVRVVAIVYLTSLVHEFVPILFEFMTSAAAVAAERCCVNVARSFFLSFGLLSFD